ncbi:MAG TPA: hypothetical protein VEI97_01380, partial [bacterium]|nr:hypothetical protein [bacterium]
MTVRANPAKPQHDNLICLFGNLHAHSALSGDIKSHDLKLRMAPQTAFEYAHAHGLDFLAL